MKLAKFRHSDGTSGIAWASQDDAWHAIERSTGGTLQELLEDPRHWERAQEWARRGVGEPISSTALEAPVDRQEIWAAGVTYRRSQAARMEESEAAASCYDRVYSSPRPELFLKATPHRVVGPSQPVRIRQDAIWNVPEPELTLVLNSRLELVGYTIGNDMSSRDIEGENPLYLPQAKVYRQCCAVGPAVTLAPSLPNVSELGVRMTVTRDAATVFEGETSTSQMARSPLDLVGWLARDNEFPNGVFLLTGTGVVPPREFTLQPGDEISITIDGLGTLCNPVVQGPFASSGDNSTGRAAMENP